MAAPSRKLEEMLAALKTMERASDPPDLAAVREALGSKAGALVAAAARMVASRELRAMTGELVPAFVRLIERPTERDPGCRGKIAIAKALRELGAWEDEVFVRGVALVQEEPMWGGNEDTAAELRAECAMAFAHAGRKNALDVLADLLADKERAATPLLVQWCEETTTEERSRVGDLALALLRDEAATDYLLECVREGETADAVAAVKALATFRDDPRLAARLREAAKGRERVVTAAVMAALG